MSRGRRVVVRPAGPGRTRHGVLLALLLASAVLASCDTRPAVPEDVRVTAVVGGRLFDGEGFTDGTLYMVGDTFTRAEPRRVDDTLDVSGLWLVPPFGDAHTHNLDGAFGLEEIRRAYRDEGTFYVQVLTNTTRGATAVRDTFDAPGTLDVAYANAGITSALGHPFLAYEPRAMGIFGQAQMEARAEELCASRARLGDAYFFVDDEEELADVWPRWLATDPDVLKIFLLHSEDFDPVPTCQEMGHRGLDPELVPGIVERAHRAGLRVWAHVESAHDFEVAVRAGVDGAAHLPGYQAGPDDERERYLISEEVARMAGAGGLLATPTVALAEAVSGGDSTVASFIRDIQRTNIRTLRRHGVELVVGSDYYGRTATSEVEALRALGIWTDAELLRMWSMATPRAIHPDRKIGGLWTGYEASFLALACDPLTDWSCTRRIEVVRKEGRPTR